MNNLRVLKNILLLFSFCTFSQFVANAHDSSKDTTAKKNVIEDDVTRFGIEYHNKHDLRGYNLVKSYLLENDKAIDLGEFELKLRENGVAYRYKNSKTFFKVFFVQLTSENSQDDETETVYFLHPFSQMLSEPMRKDMHRDWYQAVNKVSKLQAKKLSNTTQINNNKVNEIDLPMVQSFTYADSHNQRHRATGFEEADLRYSDVYKKHSLSTYDYLEESDFYRYRFLERHDYPPKPPLNNHNNCIKTAIVQDSIGSPTDKTSVKRIMTNTCNYAVEVAWCFYKLGLAKQRLQCGMSKRGAYYVDTTLLKPTESFSLYSVVKGKEGRIHDWTFATCKANRLSLSHNSSGGFKCIN